MSNGPGARRGRQLRRAADGGWLASRGCSCLAGAPGQPFAWLLALCLGLAAPARAQDEPPAGDAGSPAPAEAEKPIPTTWYAQALAYSESGINVTHFWSKDIDKLRAETVVAGHRVVTIVNGDTYYAYDLLSRAGLAIKRSPVAVTQDAARRRPFGSEVDAVLRLGGEYMGTETLAGRTVDVFQVTDNLGKRKVWVSNDDRRLTIRLTLFRRATGQTLHTDFLNWSYGLPIADAYFVPEADVRLLQVGFEEYLKKQANREPLGPVPVLYTDLLHGH